MAAQEFTKSSRELIARSTQARPQKVWREGRRGGEREGRRGRDRGRSGIEERRGEERGERREERWWMAAQEFVKSTRELIARSNHTRPPEV